MWYLATLFIGAAICYPIWYIVHTIFIWHRLCHIPSASWYAPLSYLWLAKTTWSGRQYWVHRDLHENYGPLVRIGPNEIVTDDTQIIKHISSVRSGYTRSSYYQAGRFNPYHDNLLSTLDPGVHRTKKATLAPACTERTMPCLEQGVDEQIVTLMQVLRQRYANETQMNQQTPPPLVDLVQITCFFTMDVITHLAFGTALGYLRDEADHYGFFATLRKLWPRMSASADVPHLRDMIFSKWFLKLFGPRSTDRHGFGALMGIAQQLVSERFTSSEKAEEQDMLNFLISRGFTKEECEVEGLLLLLSGSESTACAIRSAIVHTSSSPRAYSRLKAEIRAAVEDRRVCSYPISSAETSQLPYLQAIVYESIRMRPPLLGFWPKIVPAPGDEFHGKNIPEGTLIGVNHSALLRNKQLFGADADIFRPERFLELETTARQQMERNVELAFGYGPWMCAGKSIAFMELKKVMFEIFRSFDMQLASPFTPCDAIASYGVFIEKDLLCRVSLDENAMQPRTQSYEL